MKNTLKKMFTVLLVTHEQASAGCARGSRALRGTLLLALTFGLALGASAENRAPDYTTAGGKDWMYNHTIGMNVTCSEKKYSGEAAESSVDLFYVYPTLVGDEKIVIDGFRGIDDETMRGDTVPSKLTAKGAFHGNGRCFAEMTHVYAPYYRQATLDKAMDCATNELGQTKATANADYLKALYEGPAYADVTNALETYFLKWNRGRKFMLAGHSQGSAILRLVMENYFMQDEHKDYLKNLVASYQIGYGVSKAKMDEITKKTGVTFATDATNTGVIVSYNLYGRGDDANSVLLPNDAIAINPLTWTTNTTPADKSLNLGAITNESPERIVNGLYGATVNAGRGVVECAEFPESSYIPPGPFGEKSLHGQDYAAYWENLRENNYVRGGKSAGFCKLCTTNFPAHLCVSNSCYTTNDDPTTWKWVDPVGGTVWVPTNNLSEAKVYLVPEKGYRMFYDATEKSSLMAQIQSCLKDGEFIIPDDQLSPITFEWIQRAPDYADQAGKDWLFNHDIPEKRYEGEPTQDPGVDLFYLYPTSVSKTNDHAVDNICDIDDETMRGDGEYGALSSWKMSGEVFGAYTRVYAPYYRQTPVDFEVKFVHEGEYGVTNANDRMAEWWYGHAPYTDVTNALTYYFTEINPNGERPFIFAGHSHGSGMLRLVMERFFTNDVQKAWLKNMVACYAIGFGVGKDVEETIREKAGVNFATNATDKGVYVMWNTQGAGVTPGEPAALWPSNAVAAVNPLTWTREADAYAEASLNLGGWTTNEPSTIEAGLYDASNFVANGTIICSSLAVTNHFIPAEWGFGENSLHGWDYMLYWENIRENGARRAGLSKVTYEVFEYAAGECPKPVYVLSGKTVERPTDPTSGVEGVFFGGWYTNQQCSAEAYDFAMPVTTNFTLYACWTNEYGKFLSPALLPGTFLPEPKEPRDGFTANWQSAAGAWGYEITVQCSNAFNGAWCDYLTATNAYDALLGKLGSTNLEVSASSEIGGLPGSYRYVVKGLDKDNGNPTEADIETTNMVFRVPARVTFQSEIPKVKDTGATNQFVYVGGCAEYEDLGILYVTNKVDETETVTRYIHKGWYTDSTCTQTNDFTQAVTNDLTLYALWKEVHAIPTCPDYASIENIVSGSTDPSLYNTNYYEYGSMTNCLVRMVTSASTMGQKGYAQDVFLGGEYIDLGLHRNGAFGTKTKPNAKQVHVWTGQQNTFGMRASMTGWGDKNNTATNSEGYVVYMCPKCGYYTNRTEKVKTSIRCPVPECHEINCDKWFGGKILQNDVGGTLTRDFVTPGDKDEGWLITTGGTFNAKNNLVGATDTARGQQGYTSECNGLNLDKDSTALSAKVYYKGNGGEALPRNTNMTLIAYTELKTDKEKAGFKITQLVEFQKYDTGFDTWVTISNMTDTTKENVCYFRGFDIDNPNKWYQGSKYNTDNFYWSDPETHDAFVICAATNYHLPTITTLENAIDRSCTPFIYYAPDPRNDPQVEHKYTITPVTMSVGWKSSKGFSTPDNGYHRFFNTGMGIRFNIGDLKPGESVRLYYYSSLDPCVLRGYKNLQNRGGGTTTSVPSPQFDTNHTSYAWVRESAILYPEGRDGELEEVGFALEGPREVSGKFGKVYFVSNTCSSVSELVNKSIWLADPCEVVTNPVDETSIGYVTPKLTLKDGTYYAYYVSADNILSSALEFFMTPKKPLPVYYKAALSDTETRTEWFDFSSCSNPPAVLDPYDCTDTNAFKYLTYSGATLVDTNGVARPLSDYLRTTDDESGFCKWYVNIGTAETPEYEAYDFSQRLTNSVTLYAGWKKRSGLAIAEEGATNDVSVAESGEGWEYNVATQQLKLNSAQIDEDQGWLTVTNTMKIEISGTTTNIVPGKGTSNTTLLIVDGDKTILSDVTISNVTAVIISATDRERADQETNRVVYLSGVNTFAPDGKSVFSKLPYAKGSLTLRSLAGTNSPAAYGQDRLIITPRNRTPVVNENYVAISNLYIQGGTYGANMPCKYVDEKGGYWYFDNGDSTWTAWPFADVTFNVNDKGENFTVRNRKLFAVAQPADPVDPAKGMAFDGWYTAASGGDKWDFAKPVTGPTTLYAHWTEAKATIINEKGQEVPVKSIEEAIEKVPNGGTIDTGKTDPGTSPIVVDKSVVIKHDPSVANNPYVPGSDQAVTNSGNMVIFGESVSNYVFVAQDAAPTVEEGVKPAEVTKDDWKYLATNILTEVSQKGAETNEFGVCTNTFDLCEALKSEVKSNLVVFATSEVPNVDAVRVTVNVAVTPKDIRRNQESTVAKDMGYVKYAFDVTPVVMIEAFTNGSTAVVASNQVMVSASDFVSGTVFRVVLSAKGMRNVNKVVHLLENGRIDEYANGTSATLKTFTWDSTAGQVVILATENSEFQIWASETDDDVLVELKAGPELTDIPGFIITNVGMAVSYVTNTEIKASHGYANLPTAASMFREGYDFDGWHFTNETHRAELVKDAWGHSAYDVDNIQTNGSVFAAGELDHTLYARWIKAPIVTYDAQGGKFADGTESFSKYEYQWSGYQTTNEWVFTWNDATNATYVARPIAAPTKEGYEFIGWYDGWTNGAPRVDQDDVIHHVTGTVASTGTKLHADHTLYARWRSLAKGATAAAAADGFWTDRIATAEKSPVNPVHDQNGATLKGAISGQTVPSDFIIPERIGDVTNSAPVLAIGKKSFDYDHYDSLRAGGELTSVYIPTYAKIIESYAFEGALKLTNIVFSQTRDYANGEKTVLQIKSAAFANTDLRMIVFPAGLKVNLASGAFEGCTNLTSVYFFGDAYSISAGPFRKGGNPSAPFKIYLSPTLAADATLVQKLTNAMNSASIELVKNPLGSIDWTTPKVQDNPMTVYFTPTFTSMSPWTTVNEKTVRLFYATNLIDIIEATDFDGIGNALPVKAGTLKKSEAAAAKGKEYEAQFTKPTSVTDKPAAFFKLTIGPEK